MRNVRTAANSSFQIIAVVPAARLYRFEPVLAASCTRARASEVIDEMHRPATFVPAFLALLMTAGITGAASRVLSSPPPKPVAERGTQAAMTGPNLMADSSFESMETRALALDAPFRVVAALHAQCGRSITDRACGRGDDESRSESFDYNGKYRLIQ